MEKRYNCTFCRLEWISDSNKCPLCDKETDPIGRLKNVTKIKLRIKQSKNIRKIAELTIENKEIEEVFHPPVKLKELPEMGFSFDDDVEDNVGLVYQTRWDCRIRRVVPA